MFVDYKTLYESKEMTAKEQIFESKNKIPNMAFKILAKLKSNKIRDLSPNILKERSNLAFLIPKCYCNKKQLWGII